MLKIKKHGVLLEPTQRDFENLAVFNPAVCKEGNDVYVFYRGMDKEHRSCIGYARLEGPTTLIERWKKPIISREFNYESKGVEDPRIVKLDDLFYLFYVAHDGKNALTAYAVSEDLKNFEKKGIITAQIPYRQLETIFKEAGLKESYSKFANFYEEMAGEDVLFWGKDVFLFPKKFNGRFALLHRVLPGIQIAFFDSLEDLTEEFWREHFRHLAEYTILENEYWFESSHIGGGCPPIEIEEGWLLIFHTTEKRETGEKIYRASAALLDKKNPLKLLGRLKNPLFSPEKEWETLGVVPNVVFPTGTALFNGELYIYYGAADTRVAVASLNIQELVKELKKTPNNNASRS